jgi:xanthine dehydrogenase iron-sulfur cluster and FAD-binding subunit A
MLDKPPNLHATSQQAKRLDPALLARFAAIVGEKFAITDPDLQAPYLVEMRNMFQGHTPVVLRPASVAEVSAILKLANDTGTAIVPQGGNTGLVGGQIPLHNEIVLSLNRMDRIREVDPTSNTITCEAGVTLQRTREAAAEVDRLYPQLLPSEGTCTIGGNLSTNAGGTAAIAHGIARSHVLGIEVVLADGRIMNNLNKLKKDNTGYFSSAPKARSASSPRRCCGWCRGRARWRPHSPASNRRKRRWSCSALPRNAPPAASPHSRS